MNLLRGLVLFCLIVFCFCACDGQAQEFEELANKSILRKKIIVENLENLKLRITMKNSFGEEYSEDVDLSFNLKPYKGKKDKVVSSEITTGIEGQTVIRTVYRLESGEEYAEDVDLGFNLIAY